MIRTLRKICLLSLAVVLTSVVVPGPPAAAAAAPFTIGGFESDDEGWTLGLGNEFPGAQGSLTRDSSDAASGGHSGLVSADFSDGGQYVQIRRDLDADLDRVALAVRTENVERVGLRLIDSTGQVHQQQLTLDDTADWQELEVTTLAGGTRYRHWNGANDGLWHGPASQIALIVDKGAIADEGSVAEVWFDAITIEAPLELTIEPATPGGAFTAGETATFTVLSGADSLTWMVTDFHGHQVTAGDGLPTDGEYTLEVPDLDVGYYEVVVVAEESGHFDGRAQTSFSVLDPFDVQTVADSPFGFSTHLARPPWQGIAPLIAASGANNVRDEQPWGAVERQPGEYSFPQAHQAYMEDLAEEGIAPLTVLAYVNRHYDNGATPYTDEGRAGFANYGAAVVEHYDGQIPWVEVFNEFNHTKRGDAGDGPADALPEYYYPLLQATYERVKSTSPETMVVGPATAGLPLPWIEELFALGALDYLDAVSVHPYVYPDAPEGEFVDRLEALDALIREYNDGESMPIWITEQGWPTFDGTRGVTEREQASIIVRAHAMALSHGVDRYFWYDFMNDGVNNANAEHNFGIVRNAEDPLGAWAPKPAFVSYSTMTRELTGRDYQRTEVVGEGLHSVVFAEPGDSSETRMLWSTDGDQSVEVRTDAPITVTSMMGEDEVFTPVAGRVSLTATDEPQYLTSRVAADGTGVSVHPTSRLALVADTSEVMLGEQVELTLQVSNTELPPNRIRGSLEIAGESIPVNVLPHRHAQIPVSVDAATAPGPLTLTGQLVVDGRPAAQVQASVTVKHPLEIATRHILADGQDVLRVQISNSGAADAPVGALSWSAAEDSQAVDVPPVPGGGEVSVDIPLMGSGSAPYQLWLSVPGYPGISETGTIAVHDPESRYEIARTPIIVDGLVEEVPGTVVDLSDGEVRVDGYTGPEDLSGDVSFTWDSGHLYLSAVIRDDHHVQTSTGDQIWEGDSIQFGLTPGQPGEYADRYEYGLALTETGPQAYRWTAIEGGTGPAETANVAIVRDDSTSITTYELAIPWEDLGAIEPANGLVGVSLLVNEDDGAGRAGWIEWGSGIGSKKDPSLYRPAVFAGD